MHDADAPGARGAELAAGGLRGGRVMHARGPPLWLGGHTATVSGAARARDRPSHQAAADGTACARPRATMPACQGPVARFGLQAGVPWQRCARGVLAPLASGPYRHRQGCGRRAATQTNQPTTGPLARDRAPPRPTGGPGARGAVWTAAGAPELCARAEDRRVWRAGPGATVSGTAGPRPPRPIRRPRGRLHAIGRDYGGVAGRNGAIWAAGEADGPCARADRRLWRAGIPPPSAVQQARGHPGQPADHQRPGGPGGGTRGIEHHRA